MAFLNPAILFGLLAVSIPILIHLFNLKRVQKIEFSTLMFIKELQKSKLRRIKIMQLLLLLFRILIIAFLVLCFARPVFKGYAGESSASKTTIIFVDDSFSMSVKDEKGAYLEQSKNAVNNILQKHKEDDEVYLVPVSSLGISGKKYFYRSFKELQDSAALLTPSYKKANYNEIINFANDLLRNNKNLIKEVYIISDFQKSNLADKSVSINSPVAGGSLNENTYLFLVNVGERAANNLSLENFRLTTRLIDKNRNIRFTVDLANHSIYNVVNKNLNLYVNDIKAGEKVVDAGSLSKTQAEFTFRPSASGSMNGYVELVQSEFQDDELSEDNKLYFSVYIPEQFNVGIISDNPQDARFIRLALETAEDVIADSGTGTGGFFNIQVQSSVTDNIKTFDAVFITGKNSFSESEAGILKDYLTAGGGAFIFPSQTIDINNYNNVLLSRLNSVRINGVTGAGEETKFEKMDFQHPLLADIFENEKLSITTENFRVESPNLRLIMDLLPNDNTSSLITLNNGKYFIAESKVGEGKLLISSVSALTDFSDFPLKSLFAPIVIRGVYYMGNNYAFQKDHTVARTNIISVRGLQNTSNITLPDKKTINLNEFYSTNNPSGGFFAMPYESFSKQPGIYTLADSVSGKTFSFALNFDPSEGPLEKEEPAKLEAYFDGYGYGNIVTASNPDELNTVVAEARFGLDLWKYFLVLALLCLAAEYFISKKLERG